ncbi:unnamed protein product [Rotaria sp. Silwood1]|nr:unnamed protein product [Rotaria sp. Silwood1]CAF1674340.1 unnamed protein product [Rotaria sp. Silwood1]
MIQDGLKINHRVGQCFVRNVFIFFVVDNAVGYSLRKSQSCDDIVIDDDKVLVDIDGIVIGSAVDGAQLDDNMDVKNDDDA